MSTKPIILISLGGSLIAPKEGINSVFLREFRKLIEKHIARGTRFVLITGGGKTAREYQAAARELGELDRSTLDWIGIHATRLNAHLVRTIFGKHAHHRVVTDPKGSRNWKKSILVVAGWKPGCSTDHDAVLLARELKAGMLINLSNIDWVYTKDPNKFKDATPIKATNWKEFRKMVGTKWDPGLHVPFDPIASRLAEKMDLRVVITNGKDLKNLDAILLGKTATGTVIEK